MSLTEEVSFGKDGEIERYPLYRKLYLSLVIILTAGLSFGLGRLSGGGERAPIRLDYEPELSIPSVSQEGNKTQTANVLNAVGNSVVASKNGKKYHFTHCPGAKQISEANKITFESPTAAEASGYTRASNCKPR
jgi:hypothetical protein